MPFARPTLGDLRRQTAADVASSLPGADGLLRFSNLMVIGTCLAGMANLHYGYLDWIARMAVPWSAEDEYLEGWAGLVGVERHAAEKASGTIEFAGAPGAVIAAGRPVVRADGLAYVTTGEGVVAGDGTVTVPAQAVNPGSSGNADAGVRMTLGMAVPGVQSTGSAASAFTGGVDVEQNEPLRSRMLERYRAPPQGGAADDYVTWARGVPGVTRAWTARNGQGPGTVVVYFMMDQAQAAHGGFPQGSNGVAAEETRDIPAEGDQLAVAEAIWPMQPVTALVYACAPIAAPQDFTIDALSPNTTAMRAAVAAAISDVFLRRGEPGGTVPFADVSSAVDAVPGILDFIITSPLADITTAAGHIPTLGAISWT